MENVSFRDARQVICVEGFTDRKEIAGVFTGQDAGYHETQVDGSRLASGTCFYML
jgi:hypothetical protein